MIKNPKIGPEILPDLWDQNHPSPRIEAVKRGIFAGRLIPNKIIALWNNNKAAIDLHLNDFLTALRNQGYASDQTAISTPVYYPFFAGGKQDTAADNRKEAETPQFDPRILHIGAGLGKLKAQYVSNTPQQQWAKAMNLPPG
jgi:hypothetical protein